MADNPGAYPLDPTTDVGRLRVTIGDTVSTPYSPVRPGEQNYGMFSDVELEVYLDQGGGVLRAAGLAYTSLAAQASLHAKSVKDYDLSVDLTKRGDALLKIAQEFFDLADGQDAGSADGFEIVQTGLPLPNGGNHSEGMPWVVRGWPWC